MKMYRKCRWRTQKIKMTVMHKYMVLLLNKVASVEYCDTNNRAISVIYQCNGIFFLSTVTMTEKQQHFKLVLMYVLTHHGHSQKYFLHVGKHTISIRHKCLKYWFLVAHAFLRFEYPSLHGSMVGSCLNVINSPHYLNWNILTARYIFC